jgi:hypothetical protein
MEPEGSLPHLQVPATCPYPEPDQSSPRSHIQSSFLKTRLVYRFQITALKKSFILELQKSLFCACEETETDVFFSAPEWCKMRSTPLREQRRHDRADPSLEEIKLWHTSQTEVLDYGSQALRAFRQIK